MDQNSLTELIRAHQAEVYRYLRYLGAADDVAEDLVQETFLAAFRSADPPLGKPTRVVAGCGPEPVSHPLPAAEAKSGQD